MQTVIRMIFLVCVAVVLNACKLEPDWERRLSATQAGEEARVEWFKASTLNEQGQLVAALETIVPGVNRQVDVLLVALDQQGHQQWQQQVSLGDNEEIIDLVYHQGAYYLLANTSDGQSHIASFDLQGALNWVYRYQDGSARDIRLSGDRVYSAGKRIVVINTQGQLQLTFDHSFAAAWRVEPSLLGEIYVASAEGTYAYDASGNRQWFWPNSQTGLSRQAEMVWHGGVLYIALQTLDGKQAWVKCIDSQNGLVAWERSFSLASYNNSPGRILFDINSDDELVLVQSSRYERQYTWISNSGQQLRKLANDSGYARDMAITSEGHIVVVGNGLTEEYDNQGERLYWSRANGQAQITSGVVELAGASVFVGQSLVRDGEIGAWLAFFSAER